MAGELFQLNGKKALVTGGSRGIGLAIAKGLAQHGADVAITARNDKQLQDAKNQIQSCCDSKVWTFVYDIRNVEGIYSFFEEVTSQAETIDILVNNAGTTGRASEDLELSVWNEVMQVNLTAVFAMSQAFCRHRKQHEGGGKIINIGSLMCQRTRPYNPPYAASKGGVLLLTKELAVDWARYKINVNAIGPGWFPTDMTGPLKKDEKFNQWIISNTPFGRWGKTEELVGTAVFLSSSASDFVTGQIIYVDGGWLALM